MQGINIKAAGDILDNIAYPFEFVDKYFGLDDIIIDGRWIDDKEFISNNKSVKIYQKSVGFLNYDFGSDLNTVNTMAIIEDIKKLKKSTDYIIVLVNWGIKGEWYPIPWNRELAFKMVDYGANLILGYGPGVVQGIEEYDNGLIVYSLGRFVGLGNNEIKSEVPYKDQMNKFTNYAFVLDCEFSGDKISWDIDPVMIDKDGRPKPVNHVAFRRFVKDELSQGFRIGNYNFYFQQFRVLSDQVNG